MRSCIVFIVLVSTPAILFGGTAGIEGRNYQISISGSDSDIGNRYSFSGQARLPVANYTGVTLRGSFAEFNGKNNYIDSTSRSIGLGAFIRNYDYGIVNIGYMHTSSEHDSWSGSKESSIDSFSLNGTYYVDKFDFSISRSIGTPDEGSSIHRSNIGAAYYITENLRASIAIGGMDADETNSFNLLFQPKALNNTVSVSASYQDNELSELYGFSIAYYFNTKVSVNERIRKY